jgi:hypothetical protein
MNVPKFFGGRILKPADKMTRAHSEMLCKRIEEVWHACGHTNVRAWVDVKHAYHRNADGETVITEIHTIASNLVNGLPPGTVMKEAA